MQHGRQERGASSVEYSLIVFAIAAFVVASMFAFGQSNRGLYADSCERIEEQVQFGTASTCP